MLNEMWKDIKNYEGLYQISNLGNVRSVERKIWNGRCYCKINEKIMKATDNGYGYLIVGLSKNGKRKNHYVHKLVAEAFIINQENKLQVNHISGDKNDNSVNNLEWVSPRENMIHSRDVLHTKYNLIGLNASREKQKKKVQMYNLNNFFVKEFNSIAEASGETRISPSMICGCCKGIYKTGGGYVWRYAI